MNQFLSTFEEKYGQNFYYLDFSFTDQKYSINLYSELEKEFEEIVRIQALKLIYDCLIHQNFD